MFSLSSLVGVRGMICIRAMVNLRKVLGKARVRLSADWCKGLITHCHCN